MINTEMNYQEINNTYDAMKELYVEYCEALDKEKKNLELLSNQIKETKEYIQYLDTHQNSDAYVFSPRGVISKNNAATQEGIFDSGKTIDFSDAQKKKDELSKYEEEKSTIEKNIIKLESTISLLEKNKNILKEIKLCSDIEKEYKDKQEILQKDFEDKKNDLYKSLKEGPINRLSYILHMMEMINTFIDNDPVRAKLELTNIKNDLQLISKEIEKTVAVPEGDNL